jgi:hypothetical protein
MLTPGLADVAWARSGSKVSKTTPCRLKPGELAWARFSVMASWFNRLASSPLVAEYRPRSMIHPSPLARPAPREAPASPLQDFGSLRPVV